jgi:protoporphyrin/coproporphyrin ferrochelatase
MTEATTSMPRTDATVRPASREGVLLANLGSPDAPRTPEVRRYLREFLSDPRVIDIPAVPRWLLLNLFILPFRPRKSAEAYRKIWMEDGSPLLVHGNALRAELEARLDRPVALGMRYGKPSIADAMRVLKTRGVDRIAVLPLYPQVASASSGTVLEKVFIEAGREWNVPDLVTVPAFFDDPGFIAAWEVVGRPVLERVNPDHVLFSFHGLPERQVRKADPSGSHCLARVTCCDGLGVVNRNCYRAQCFATARAMALALKLPAGGYTVAFQSRLGRDPWIKPYTDHLLREFPDKGVKRLVVFCPAFVADCLETLEEIGLRGRDTFLAAGGDTFAMAPSLNATPRWVETVADLVRKALGQSPSEQ